VREPSESPLDQLRRWEDFGATWQVVHRDHSTVTVALCRCDGGEEVGRITTADADLVAYVTQDWDEDL